MEQVIKFLKSEEANKQYFMGNPKLKEAVERLIERNKELEENKDKQIEQYQNMLATNDMLHVLECEKKDKMIELMLEEISKNILNTCPFADYNVDLDCENKCKDDYKACWKKYYERKVENGN